MSHPPDTLASVEQVGNDMANNTNLEHSTEMTWEVDGEEYQLVRFTDGVWRALPALQ